MEYYNGERGELPEYKEQEVSFEELPESVKEKLKRIRRDYHDHRDNGQFVMDTGSEGVPPSGFSKQRSKDTGEYFYIIKGLMNHIGKGGRWRGEETEFRVSLGENPEGEVQHMTKNIGRVFKEED